MSLIVIAGTAEDLRKAVESMKKGLGGEIHIELVEASLSGNRKVPVIFVGKVGAVSTSLVFISQRLDEQTPLFTEEEKRYMYYVRL